MRKVKLEVPDYLSELTSQCGAWKQRCEFAEKRVAELESQLADARNNKEGKELPSSEAAALYWKWEASKLAQQLVEVRRLAFQDALKEAIGISHDEYCGCKNYSCFSCKYIEWLRGRVKEGEK